MVKTDTKSVTGLAAVSCTLAAALIAGCFMVSASSEVAAHTKAETARGASLCMTHISRDNTEFSIILPAAYAERFTKKGFKPVACSKAFPSRASLEAFRDEMCEAASRASKSLEVDLELHLGERPSVLCAMAEVTIGPWQQGDN